MTFGFVALTSHCDCRAIPTGSGFSRSISGGSARPGSRRSPGTAGGPAPGRSAGRGSAGTRGCSGRRSGPRGTPGSGCQLARREEPAELLLARGAAGEGRVGEEPVRVGAERRRLVVAVEDDAVEEVARAVERARGRVRHGAVAVRGLEGDVFGLSAQAGSGRSRMRGANVSGLPCGRTSSSRRTAPGARRRPCARSSSAARCAAAGPR